MNQTVCTCQSAADTSRYDNLIGSCAIHGVGPCYASATACHNGLQKDFCEQDRKCQDCIGLPIGPRVQCSCSMHHSRSDRERQLKRPRLKAGRIHLHEELHWEAAPRSAEAAARHQNSSCDKDNLARGLPRTQGRHWEVAEDGQMQQLLGESMQPSTSVHTAHREAAVHRSHEQLLADIGGFINALTRPCQISTSTLQPRDTATECELVHANIAKAELPKPWQRSILRQSQSGTDESTVIASAGGSSWETARGSGCLAPKARSDSSHESHTELLPVEAADGEGYNNDIQSPAANSNGRLVCKEQEGRAAVLRNDHDGAKVVSTAGKIEGRKQLGKTHAKASQAVHKLHDLEDVAQASLDELESLLREEQLKVRALVDYHTA